MSGRKAERMRRLMHLASVAVLASLLLAGTAEGQGPEGMQQMHPQIQSPQDEPPRSCTSKVESEINRILERTKVARASTGWTVEVPSNQSVSLEGQLNGLRLLILDCQPLRNLVPIFTGKPKASLEELLNSVRIVATGTKLKAELGEVERNNKGPEPPRETAKGIDQVLEKLEAIGTRLKQVEVATEQPPPDGLVRILVFVAVALAALCLLCLGFLIWVVEGNSRTVQDLVDEFDQRIKSNSARSQTIEGRIGALERQRALDAGGRELTKPKPVGRETGVSDIVNRMTNAAGDEARIEAERAAKADWDRRYHQLMKTVVESMKSFDAFEALKAQYQIMAIERDTSSTGGAGPVLKSTIVDLDKVDFWGIELGGHTLMFPGRRLYTIAHALADMNGQKGLSMFADLFEIHWDARDLRIDQPAFIQRNDRGGFTVQQPGHIGLFRIDA